MKLASLQSILKENILSFYEPKEYQVKKDSKIKYKRLPIEVVHPDGKKGPLLIESPFLFSFGVSERKIQETDKLAGYSLPVCLCKKDDQPTD